MKLGTSFAGSVFLAGIPTVLSMSFAVKLFASGDATGKLFEVYRLPFLALIGIVIGITAVAFVGAALLGKGTHTTVFLARCSDGRVFRVERSFYFSKQLSEKFGIRYDNIRVSYAELNGYLRILLQDPKGVNTLVMQTKSDSKFRAFLKKLEKVTKLQISTSGRLPSEQ